MYMTVLKHTGAILRKNKRQYNLFNGNDVHQLLTYILNTHRKDGGILYRKIRQGNIIYLYVQSSQPLNCVRTEAFGLTVVKQFDIENTLLEQLHDNDIIVFDTLLIPIKSKRTPGKERGIKCSIKQAEDRIQWVQEQFKNIGLSILPGTLSESGKEPVTFCKILHGANIMPCVDNNNHISSKSAIQKASLDGYVYRGYAMVDDKKAFIAGITNGIGICKNYGSGAILFRHG